VSAWDKRGSLDLLLRLTVFSTLLAAIGGAEPPGCPPASALAKDVVCRGQPDRVLKFERRTSPSAQPSFFQRLADQLRVTVVRRPFERSIAFLAAVGEYTHHDSLRWVQTDLVDLRSVLLDRGFDTVYVAGESAVTAQLLDTYMMNILPKEMNTSDRLLFYYSGHGGDLQGASGYLLFRDAPQGQTDFQQTMPILNVLNWSQKSPAKHAVFLFDACMSGLGWAPKDGGALDSIWINHVSGGPSRNLITAGTADEKTYEITSAKDKGYSLFTRAFLNAIRDGGNSGPTRGVQLLDEVFAATKAHVLRTPLPGAKTMTPRMWDLKYVLNGKEVARQGTFLFLDPKATPQRLSPTVAAYLGAKAKDDAPPSAMDRTFAVRLLHRAQSADGAEAIKASLSSMGYTVESIAQEDEMNGVNTLSAPSTLSSEARIVAEVVQKVLAATPGYELINLSSSETVAGEGPGAIEIRLGPPLRLAKGSAIQSGSAFTCVLFDGEVNCWGAGRGAIFDRKAERVELDPVNTLAVGGQHACGLTITGRLFCWGKLMADLKQLQMLPVEPSANRRFTDVSAGLNHTCAIGYLDGLIYCWGLNSAGQLGYPPVSTAEWQADPKAVGTPHGVRFQRVSAGFQETCGLTENRGLYCWGRLWKDGPVSPPAVYLPGQQIAHVSVNRGDYGICEITAKGAAACQNIDYSQMPQVVSQPGYQAIDLIGYHAVALDKQGRVWHWGYNDSLPEYHYPKAEDFGGTFIAVGHDAPIFGIGVYALQADGKLKSWSSYGCGTGCYREDTPWIKK
jgi:hypothetical protein